MHNRVLVLLLIFSLLTPGCWDRKEVEDTAYVVSLAVDAAEPQADDLIWTFRIGLPEHVSGGTSAAGLPAISFKGELISVRGVSLEQGVQLLQAGLTRIVTLEQMRYIVFGEEVARRGLGPLISQLLRHNQVRRGIGFAVAPGRAVDVFMANQPVTETSSIKMVEGWLLVQKQMHLSPPSRLHHFYAHLLTPGQDPVGPLFAINPTAQQSPGSSLPPMHGRSLKAGEFPRTGGNPIEFAGTAVFRRDHLVGMLTVDETAALLFMQGNMGKVYNSVPDPMEPGTFITLRFGQENKPQYRIALVGDQPTVHIKLQLEGELLSTPGKTDYSKPENRRTLEQFVAKHLVETNYNPLIRQVYGEWGADPIGLGHLFRRRFPTMNEWLNYRWADRVQDTKVTVELKLMIRRFGLLLQNPEEKLR